MRLDASERAGQHEALFATVLVALLGFYLLERAALWRHAHPDSDGHAPAAAMQGAACVVLLGDGVHNFVDGVLIAAAFLADPWPGLTTTLAVVAHEVPQELGDFVPLLSSGWSRQRALLANAASSLASVAGGVVGWLLLDGARAPLPYALAVAAASVLYVAVADLLPLLHRRRLPLIGRWLH